MRWLRLLPVQMLPVLLHMLRCCLRLLPWLRALWLRLLLGACMRRCLARLLPLVEQLAG